MKTLDETYTELKEAGYEVNNCGEYLVVDYNGYIISIRKTETLCNFILNISRNINGKQMGVVNEISDKMFSYMGDRKLYYDMIFRTIVNEFKKIL